MQQRQHRLGEAIVAQLISMGFSENGCKRACKETKNAGPEAATEWVFSHMNDADFAAPFVDEDDAPAEKKVDEAAVNELMMFGFTPRQAEAALTVCDSNKEEAVHWLLSRHDDGIDAAVAEVLDGPAPAPPSDAFGVVEGVDGGRVVVKMDCGPRVVVAVLGGATYSELRAAYEVSRDTHREVIMGGSALLAPGGFLASLAD